ncbi:NADH-dependent flavin oxidoreductase [Chytridium lagenaria]|nr:NADH-dependent flavin oxidoreductase [Chytridium lagenaria]
MTASHVPPYPTKIPTASPGKLGPNPGSVTTTLDPASKAKLFQPLTIRSVTLKNRVVVSPMCQYSAVDGVPNVWHFSHLGAYAARGVGTIIVEATGVTPNGRITPNCLGIWSDDLHLEPFKAIVSQIKSMGAAAGIQLAHAGRKSSCLSPFFADGNHSVVAEASQDGWPENIVGPTADRFSERSGNPRELTVEEIKSYVKSFADAAVRADKAGFDIVEIHGAHGYLAHTFYSPLSNKRTDEYGGSFENRIRFLLDTAKAVRAVWPESKPLFVRLSAVDYAEGGWTIEDSVELSKRLKEVGVDVIDASSGGAASFEKTNNYFQPGYNIPYAERIRKETGLITGSPGNVTEAKQAEEILESGRSDLIFLGRVLLRDPSWVLGAAAELGAEVEWPHQYRRGKARI